MIVVRTPEHVKLSGPDANLIEVTVKKMTPNKSRPHGYQYRDYEGYQMR